MTQPGWAYPSPDQPSADFDQLAGPVHVPSLTAAERTDLLSQLRPWVAQLVTRFHIDARVIPPCWERHNGMLEALTALRDLERDCYSHKAPPSAAVDWFRGFREIEARLIELASLTNCTAREHRDPPAGWSATQTPSQTRAAATDHDRHHAHRPAGGAPPVDVT
ncbi:hypothetical protein [Humibacillus xanthopallidus]|uniref:Uncharacterized protein n=1 Tax=Humibacillus xanthopallidus TaxID=412689 RepID=A0A543HTM9_9MICO|nr:hypothetical protein [Humibacillus xanthopallidus]TQM61716.1 hypothetical protein FBY41_1728 [Humibacillus xanthopallidus]